MEVLHGVSISSIIARAHHALPLYSLRVALQGGHLENERPEASLLPPWIPHAVSLCSWEEWSMEVEQRNKTCEKLSCGSMGEGRTGREEG
jgi:hypothetical protein